jgi:hypothetical protein
LENNQKLNKKRVFEPKVRTVLKPFCTDYSLNEGSCFLLSSLLFNVKYGFFLSKLSKKICNWKKKIQSTKKNPNLVTKNVQFSVKVTELHNHEFS